MAAASCEYVLIGEAGVARVRGATTGYWHALLSGREVLA
jgi:hypothetical protein